MMTRKESILYEAMKEILELSEEAEDKVYFIAIKAIHTVDSE